ncbi:MAG: hypothetical protein KAR84_01700 [Elusimicrobiales bacterium]|nr:hypothetical protein [Elusimicrobiales bacterium]
MKNKIMNGIFSFIIKMIESQGKEDAGLIGDEGKIFASRYAFSEYGKYLR